MRPLFAALALALLAPLASAEPLVATSWTGFDRYAGVATQDSVADAREWELRGGGYPCVRGGGQAVVTLTVLAGDASDVVRLHLDGQSADAAPGESVTLLAWTCAWFVVEGVAVGAAAPYVVELSWRW